jgi:hypothetical protein
MFTQAELEAFWARYVSMKQTDVVYVCAAEPVFAAMLDYVWLNKLFGFDPSYNTNPPTAAYGNIPKVSGPIQS